MDNEMIERCVDHAAKLIEGYATVGAKTPIKEVVITVIKAMREPTEKMKQTEGFHCNCFTCGGHVEGWQVGIDSILNDR